MPGKNNKVKGKRMAERPKVKLPMRVERLPVGIDQAALAHARMLADPCGADLEQTVYTGDRGYINRFVRNATLATAAGATSFIYIVKPGNALGSATENSLPTTNSTISFGNGNFPGNTFFSTNAAKQRCAAFCTTIRPVAAPNTATGTLHFGIVSASSLINATAISADVAATYCSESVSVSQALMAPLDIKWVPGSFDDRYCPQGVTDDDSDRNVLLIVGIGLVPASGCQIRETAIIEWSPKTGLGVAIDSTTVKKSDCDKDCVIKYLNSRDKDWWWNLGKKTVNVATKIANGYFTGGAVGAIGSAVKFMR